MQLPLMQFEGLTKEKHTYQERINDHFQAIKGGIYRSQVTLSHCWYTIQTCCNKKLRGVECLNPCGKTPQHKLMNSLHWSLFLIFSMGQMVLVQREEIICDRHDNVRSHQSPLCPLRFLRFDGGNDDNGSHRYMVRMVEMEAHTLLGMVAMRDCFSWKL
jgi:hypothetical protein